MFVNAVTMQSTLLAYKMDNVTNEMDNVSSVTYM